MTPDLWEHEKGAFKKGFHQVAGADEAGRGPLAGPVVAAAVILPKTFSVSSAIDSKGVSPGKRTALYHEIYDHAVSIGIGIVDAVEIDRINILRASLASMAVAAANLLPQPDFLLIDGPYPIPTHTSQKPVKRGDRLSVSIGAASIIAKVTRDRLMARYHEEYPMFGFNQHKGYPTRKHKAAIEKFGCTPIHRKSFKGVKEFLSCRVWSTGDGP